MAYSAPAQDYQNTHPIPRKMQSADSLIATGNFSLVYKKSPTQIYYQLGVASVEEASTKKINSLASKLSELLK